ncbi:MAG: DUF2970 domain-containing protein [Gammaproteobacteria bacterium]|nr:DUF2970 domain-containing protein [Gammaproteobacteria bacterium]
MWFNRIINSFLGIRKKIDLNNDLDKISLKKLILLFIVINGLFIILVGSITFILLKYL